MKIHDTSTISGISPGGPLKNAVSTFKIIFCSSYDVITLYQPNTRFNKTTSNSYLFAKIGCLWTTWNRQSTLLNRIDNKNTAMKCVSESTGQKQVTVHTIQITVNKIDGFSDTAGFIHRSCAR